MLYSLKDCLQQAKIATGLLDRKVYTGPWQVQIDLTNRCNNDCIACWCNSPLIGDKAITPEVKKKQLSYETVIGLIDELAAMGVRDIYFTGGGEPFMHPGILDFMRHIKQKGMRFDMSTNFTLVTKDIAEELVEIGVDHMNISLWSATPTTYVVQHPSKSEETFHKMTEVIDYIGELKRKKGVNQPALGMYNVINAYNYQEVTQMFEYAFQHGLNDISYVPVDTVPDRTDSLQIQARQRDELAVWVAELPEKREVYRKKYKHDVVFANLELFGQRIESKDIECSNYDGELLSTLPSCYAGWSFARILANGDVNSCLKSFKTPVGNIHQESFTDIWFGEKQQEFRKHTIEYDLDDPYFKRMGNDRMTREQGCYKCCDNLGMNQTIHEKMVALNYPKELIIKLVTMISKKNIYTNNIQINSFPAEK